MSRVFWMVVGAAGGVVAYRKGTQAVQRAKELGPLGTAQVAAQTTSRLAGRTAQGLGRLNDLKAQREGRLVIGSAEEVSAIRTGPTSVVADDEWVPGTGGRPGPTPVAPAAAVPRVSASTSSSGAARPAARTSRARRA
jgi:hypothetical protein